MPFIGIKGLPNSMKILIPRSTDHLPISVIRYVENITHQIEKKGVGVTWMADADINPDNFDLLWDPAVLGGGTPAPLILKKALPRVVTVHGAGPFSLAAHEVSGAGASRLKHLRRNFKRRLAWRKFLRQKDIRYITVSHYAAYEIHTFLNIPKEQITPIYHGVDFSVFSPPASDSQNADGFLLHVSQYRPKKNIERILAAYGALDPKTRPPLIIVAPGTPEISMPSGTQLIREAKSHSELAELYRAAMAFVFPSLHETFGMPIIEAMACGCPVITSNTTACPEVSGDSALLVNPNMTDEISGAMRQIIQDAGLRESLGRKGIERSRHFPWSRTAEQHLEIFRQAMG